MGLDLRLCLGLGHPVQPRTKLIELFDPFSMTQQRLLLHLFGLIEYLLVVALQPALSDLASPG